MEHSERVARLQSVVGTELEVGDLLGQGAFADVFDAFDPRLKRRVALKVLRTDIALDDHVIRRFRNEAELVASLRHPNILPIHDIRERDGVVVLILDRVDGVTLEQTLASEPSLPFEEVVRILHETAEALAAAHQRGVVHRDLKPANIMLDGSARRMLLMDFGVAHVTDAQGTRMTQIGAFIGTPQYASPEQAAGAAVDTRSDLYSLGVIGYEMLTGGTPFDAPSVAATLAQHISRAVDPVRNRRRDCPVWLADIIERCLAKSPEERWQSADDVVQALGARTARSEPEKQEKGETLSRRAAVARFRRHAALALAACLLAAAFDLMVWREIVLSWLALLVTVVFITARYGRLWMMGIALAEVFRNSDTSSPRAANAAESEFGRHAAAVGSARQDRTHIVRSVSALTRVEQERLRGATRAADQLLARVTHLAKRLHVLDEQISGERQQARGPRTARLTVELAEARVALARDLNLYASEIVRLRELVERADRIDPALISAQLETLAIFLGDNTIRQRTGAGQSSP